MRKIIVTTAIAATSLGAMAQINSPAPDGYRQRAIDMYEDCNYTGCVDQMRYLKDNNPTREEMEDADYYIAMASLHLDKADAEALLRYFIWRYPSSPRIADVTLAIGNLYTMQGRYGEALIEFGKIAPNSLDRSSSLRRDASRAYCMLKQGDYDLALPIYQRLSRTKDFGDEARFYLGYIAYVKKDYRKASEFFKKCNTSVAPGNMADYYQAQIQYFDKDYAQACATARRLLANGSVEPQFMAEAARIAGESYYQLGDDSQAIPYLRQYVAATASPLPSSLYILGVADYRQGDYQQAITRLTEVSNQDNAMGQSANLFIGQALMQQNNYSAALIAFDRALKMQYDSSVREAAFYNYAVAKTEGGRIPFGNSVVTFEEFLKAYPDSRYAPQIREYLVAGYMSDHNYSAALNYIKQIKNPSRKMMATKQQALYALGSREVMAGKYADAISHLLDARSIKSYDAAVGAETDLWLGEAYYATGQYSKACGSYEDALKAKKLSADNALEARYGAAYSALKDGSYELAGRYFNDFLGMEPAPNALMRADALNRLADIAYVGRDFSKAARYYADAYDANPSAGDYALFQGALMKGYDGSHRDKVSSLQRMMREFPQSSLMPQAYLEIGESYSQLGQDDKSIEAYSAVAARYPRSSYGRQANLLLALSYLKDGNSTQAIDTYKQLISGAPTSEEARQASDNLKQLMADNGRLDEYAEFISSVKGASPVAASELESAAFASAEREYLNKGLTGRLTEYLDRYPQGVSRPIALGYAIEANAKSGDAAATLRYANEMIEDYPDNAGVPAALKAKADALAMQGKGELALEAYQQMSAAASSPAMLNEARLGEMRIARDLALYDKMLEAAQALMQSSTIGKEQRAEAEFAYADALYHTGRKDDAIAGWQKLAADLNDLYGTKAAYRIAEANFEGNDLKSARAAVETLIDSDTPHSYWLARGFILLSDINRAEGNTFEADQYLVSLRENYPGNETDIFKMIDDRLNNK